MRKIYLNIVLFLLPLFVFGALNAVSPHEQKVSEIENRALMEKPKLTSASLFSGAYFREYEDFYADNFTFRESLVRVSNSMKQLRGIRNKEAASIMVFNGANIFESQEAAVEEVEVETVEYEMATTRRDLSNTEKRETPEPVVPILKKSSNSKAISQNTDVKQPSESISVNEQKVEDTTAPIENTGPKVEGRVLIINGKVMEIHKFSKAAGQAYAYTLNTFADKVDSSVKVYSILVPTQIEFLEDEKYRSMSSSQKESIATVNSLYSSKVQPANVYDSLQQNIDKYIYFKTDHHWTALGAYYAYSAFTAQLGVEPVPLEKYEVEKVDNYLGSLYSVCLDNMVRNNPDTVFVYKPFIKNEYYVYYDAPVKLKVIDMSHANKERKYRIFLSGDRPLGKITTEVKNGRKLVVIKDSYGNAFVPFLLPHYEEIYIVDPRQYKGNIFELIKENEINEVLFLNYVQVLNSTGFSSIINTMMNNELQ